MHTIVKCLVMFQLAQRGGQGGAERREEGRVKSILSYQDFTPAYIRYPDSILLMYTTCFCLLNLTLNVKILPFSQIGFAERFTDPDYFQNNLTIAESLHRNHQMLLSYFIPTPRALSIKKNPLLKLQVFVTTKAVSDSEICFIKSVY